MSKYIDADCLIKELEEQKLTYKSTASTMLLDYMIGLLRVIPAEDVAPPVHGEWIFNGRTDSLGVPKPFSIKCSVCESSAGTSRTKFCPNCGAKMDGGDK